MKKFRLGTAYSTLESDILVARKLEVGLRIAQRPLN